MQLPAPIDAHVGGWSRELVWQSAADVPTWRLTSAAGAVRYLKTAPATAAVPLRAESARLRWARSAGLPVPEVVECCAAGSAEWLLTEGLPGRPAVHPALRADPATLVPLLARGLRALHATPAASCPFRFGPDDAIAIASRRARDGLVTDADLHPEHAHLSPAAAVTRLRRLRPRRPVDLVVCHGDYCLPNVLVGDGVVTGYVDLGELAVADRWWDLAVATWSLTWNLGPGWEAEFLACYGAARDDEALAFYRLAYDLVG